uniref:ADP-ribosylation factor 1-like 2 n=1 Tax=Romanomermis culicivorax TaxID=13658 RepID=A0A915KY54_ROMCU
MSSTSFNQNIEEEDDDDFSGEDNSSQSDVGSSTDRKKRVHLKCEKLRREAIKNGYKDLKNLLPNEVAPLGFKMTNASILYRAVDYLRELTQTDEQQKEEIKNLKSQLVALQLICQNYEHLSVEQEHSTVSGHNHSLSTLKYTMFTNLMDELYKSFDSTVSTDNYEVLTRSLLSWLEQQIDFQVRRSFDLWIFKIMRKMCAKYLNSFDTTKALILDLNLFMYDCTFQLSTWLGLSKKEAQVLVIGLDNSGKSTILNHLKPVEAKATDVVPTVGFNVERIQSKSLSITAFDMSGQGRYRNLWESYYKQAHGVVFVVDSSDRMRMVVARDELDELMRNPDFQRRRVPILIFANKMDDRHAMSAIEVSEVLGERDDQLFDLWGKIYQL